MRPSPGAALRWSVIRGRGYTPWYGGSLLVQGGVRAGRELFYHLSWRRLMVLRPSDVPNRLVSLKEKSINFVHRNDEHHIFSYRKVTYSYTLNKCRIMLALMYFDIGTCFLCLSKKNENLKNVIYKMTMTSSTHSFAYSYRLFNKCFVENYENKKISYLAYFYPIYNKFSLFCLKLKLFTLSNN